MIVDVAKVLRERPSPPGQGRQGGRVVKVMLFAALVVMTTVGVGQAMEDPTPGKCEFICKAIDGSREPYEQCFARCLAGH